MDLRTSLYSSRNDNSSKKKLIAFEEAFKKQPLVSQLICQTVVILLGFLVTTFVMTTFEQIYASNKKEFFS